ncbi:hypothetical protein BX616_005755, partial [Lobosporangium transversale]
MGLINTFFVHLANGTFRQSSKDQWALKVRGQGWEGFWIPFRNHASKQQLKSDLQRKITEADIGKDCDIVMFAIH